MKQGPSLNTAREDHGCARLRDGSILVAGGWGVQIVGGANKLGNFKSTEILEVGDHEWKNGPDLKEGVKLNKVVKSNGKDYIAYSIGGWEYGRASSKIYGLNVDKNEWQLVDNLNEPRYKGSAVNVPSNLIPWCKD